VSTLQERYAAHVDHIGRTRDLRRFLAALVVGGRSGTLVHRRVSTANDSFMQRFAATSDAMLGVLREPGWEPIDPRVEEGIRTIPRVSDWMASQDTRTLSDILERERDRWFRSLYVPWSHLAPIKGRSVRHWPRPRRILLAVGQHIGIGDELICFRVARRLQSCFPEASLEALSFYPTLWSLCPGVRASDAAADDPLLPLVRAVDLLREDADNLVVFVDYASFGVYRTLESLQALPRFVYVDPGAPLTRLVDSAEGWIAEYRLKGVQRLYRSLGGLLDVTFDRDITCLEGLEPPLLAGPGPRRDVKSGVGSASQPLPSGGFPRLPSLAGLPRVYVNPFSSKDYALLGADWWSAALRHAAEQGALEGGPGGAEGDSPWVSPLEVQIFAGINDTTRGYARAIADGLAGIPARLHGEDDAPTIAATLEAACDADLVFGLDTFTCHVGVLRRVPCVTVYFNAYYKHFWQVPDNHVLGAFVWDAPQVAGDMIARMLWPRPTPLLDAVAQTSLQAARATSLEERAAASPAFLDALEAALGDGADPVYADVAYGVIDNLRHVLSHVPRAASLTRDALDDAVTTALDALQVTNLVRYADYCEGASNRAGASASTRASITRRHNGGTAASTIIPG